MGTRISASHSHQGSSDYAYLAIKRNGAPMHFSEVRKSYWLTLLQESACCHDHNELIKDRALSSLVAGSMR